MRITENQRVVLEVLAGLPDGKGFAREVLARVEGKSFNCVNATLASLAPKGFVVKAKGVFEDKLLTQYTITEAGREFLTAEPTEDAE